MGLVGLVGVRGAVATGPELSHVTVGIRGQFQVGCWTSFEANVDADTWPVQVTIVAPDPDGNLTYQPAVEIPQPSQSPARVRTLFKTGRLTDTLRVGVQTSDDESSYLFQSTTAEDGDGDVLFAAPWTAATQLWGILGESEALRAAADRIVDQHGGKRPRIHVIELSDADELPAHPDALESLHLLAIVGLQPISATANEAIRRWVAAGGHLIVSVGRSEDYAALALADWIPLQVTGQSRLRDLSAITTQVPGGLPIRVDTVEALQFEFDYGDTVASTLDGPLWARLPYGFGRVSVIGVDISRRPLVDWPSLPQMCERLADDQRVSGQSQERGGTQLSQTGVSELQTQLVTGLDQYPQIDKPSNWLAMGLILVYLLAIGPLDYLIVHKLLKRPHWTWVTFPVMVLVAVGFASMTAADRNPTQSFANQVDLVDVDLDLRKARISSWMSFTSPASQRYDVGAQPASDLSELAPQQDTSLRLISWTGIPETGFRGMYRTGGLDLAKAEYELAPERDAIVGLPVAVWSSANTAATIDGLTDETNRIITAGLESQASQLSGTMTNELPVPLEDWFVAHEGRVYLPQTRTAGAAALKIAPGETIDFADGRRVVPRVLQSYLTGVRRIKVSSRNRTGEDVFATRDAYNPLARDPYETLRMASFFQATGGDNFTALTNHALDRLDFSRLLSLGRAVLFCRVRRPAARFLLNDNPVETTEHETILRIVLPVKKR